MVTKLVSEIITIEYEINPSWRPPTSRVMLNGCNTIYVPQHMEMFNQLVALAITPANYSISTPVPGESNVTR